MRRGVIEVVTGGPLIVRYGVNMDFLGGLLSAGANLLGGLFGRQSAESIAQQNIQEQMNFAQHGISWRVADAKAAGINPLAALGAQLNSFSNITGDDGSMAKGIAGAGQDIGRAVAAGADKESKIDKLNAELLQRKIAMADADITHQQLQNSQLARNIAGDGTPPSRPYDWNKGGPYDPRPHKGMPSLLTKYYNPTGGPDRVLFSPEASQAQQTVSSAPVGVLAGTDLIDANIGARSPSETFRPDVSRVLNNLNNLAVDNPQLWVQ